MALKNPNGYGSVVKLSGKRRKPYVVRKTVGYDDRAYPIYAIIGYFETRTMAMQALAEYNRKPYDIDMSKYTFAQLYSRWCETELPSMNINMQQARQSAYGHCKPLYDMVYKDIRKHDMQAVIDACKKGSSTQSNVKRLLSALDNYAYDNDIISKRYSVNLSTIKIESTAERIPFTDSEVQLLHQHEGEPYIDETLFMLYTGCRVLEMLTVKCEDIDQDIIRCGVKTAAGKNRIIPIHDCLRPIIDRHMGEGTLFGYTPNPDNKNPLSVMRTKFLRGWDKAMTDLGLKHDTHDCRHSFRSKLDGQNKVCVDLIMGHKSADVGERIYTHKTVEELKKTISTLSYGFVR